MIKQQEKYNNTATDPAYFKDLTCYFSWNKIELNKIHNLIKQDLQILESNNCFVKLT